MRDLKESITDSKHRLTDEELRFFAGDDFKKELIEALVLGWRLVVRDFRAWHAFVKKKRSIKDID